MFFFGKKNIVFRSGSSDMPKMEMVGWQTNFGWT